MTNKFVLTTTLLALVRESRERAPGDPDARPALALVGSIGFASYLTADGEVWVVEGLFDHEFAWRRASVREALGRVLSAARRLPQLGVLLPTRGPTDPVCPDCHGSGAYRGTPSWCLTCFGLGWLPPASED